MIRRALVDSNFFIAKFFSRDQYRRVARKILDEDFANGKIGKISTTDYVIVETVNFLINKGDFEDARVFLDYIVNTEGIKIVYMGDMSFYRLRKKFEKYKSLTFTDCSLILAAEDYDIDVIFSFDKGFDKVKGVKRKES